jgi:hypothetical protein
MTMKITHRACLVVQSLKVLPSLVPGESLADALYLHATAAMFSPATGYPDAKAFLDDLALRAFAAAQIGEIAEGDLARMNAEHRHALAQALAAGLPACVVAKAGADISARILPMLPRGAAPSWALELARRPRAGYPAADALDRCAGPPTESQAAHAVATAIIAWVCYGATAAMLALLHNVHLTRCPDVPHPVEERLGRDVLALIEGRACRSWMRELPRRLLRSPIARHLAEARHNPGARAAVDAADFIDRTLWLLHLQPARTRNIDRAALRAILCNLDYRYDSQVELLDQILNSHHETEM